MKRRLEVCFDLRVLSGLGVLALAIWVLAPQFLLAALPLLVLLACPLSMVLMAWIMRGQMHGAGGEATAADRLVALEREQARLGAEITRTRGELEARREAAEQHSA